MDDVLTTTELTELTFTLTGGISQLDYYTIEYSYGVTDTVTVGLNGVETGEGVLLFGGCPS